ncbi:MAG: BlaI/MecI/CopY family transcriptional regulator [Longimicrobiales bacterium]|nr:BlaI/MecI/CopY family transcriptional regulator [Longimicrobiales bacterium]
MNETKATLSRREREVMDVLYRLGEATVAEVMEELVNPPTYSAVRSTLRILDEKGHIAHREDGPRFVYAPAVGREKAQRAALDHLVDTFFEGSAEQVLVTLLRRSDLEMSESQIERLAKAIKKAGEEGR